MSERPIKYDIAAQDPLQMVTYGPDDQAQRELDILYWREQARLQAAFCEAYEARETYENLMDLDGMDGGMMGWQQLDAALDAAWAELQNFNKEVGG